MMFCSLLRIARRRNVFVVDLSVAREWRWNRSKWAQADIFLGSGSQFYVQPDDVSKAFTSLLRLVEMISETGAALFVYGV